MQLQSAEPSVRGLGVLQVSTSQLRVDEYWTSVENSPKMFTSVIHVHVLGIILIFVKKAIK